MDKGSLYDVEHWRGRAKEARALAAPMTDPKTRTTMLQIAEGYDTMAKHARERAAKANGSN
jgi:hypothetical protein